MISQERGESLRWGVRESRGICMQGSQVKVEEILLAQSDLHGVRIRVRCSYGSGPGVQRHGKETKERVTCGSAPACP